MEQSGELLADETSNAFTISLTLPSNIHIVNLSVHNMSDRKPAYKLVFVAHRKKLQQEQQASMSSYFCSSVCVYD